MGTVGKLETNYSKKNMTDTKITITRNEKPSKKKHLIGSRHYQCLLMFVTLVIAFAIRATPSVAIIAMTEETPPDPSIPTYPEWDNADTILSAFFWGYFIPQIGAGQLSEYFGPKWFLFATMTIGAVFNVLVPVMAANFGANGVLICRVVQGLTQGFLFPSIHNLLSKWTPLYERAMISNFVYSGGPLGNAISMTVVGEIAGSKMGWPMAFYVYGGLSIIWSIIFAMFISNTPSTHRGISEEEKNYIESTNGVTNHVQKKIPTPWMAIFTSLPMWGILVAGCSQCFTAFTLSTEIPSYMSNIMNFNMNDSSLLAALPYFVLFVMSLIGAPMADRLVANQTFRIGTIRKIFNSMGSFIPALALICLGFIDGSNRTIALVLLIVAVASSAFTASGYLVNLIDVAPNHAGTGLGIINGINNIFSLLAPLSVSFWGNEKTDPILWRKVFWFAAGFNIVCGVFYNIFATGEIQSWNAPPEVEKSCNPDKKTEKF